MVPVRKVFNATGAPDHRDEMITQLLEGEKSITEAITRLHAQLEELKKTRS
jgi:hypothetical protein